MSTVIKSLSEDSLAIGAAANADELGEALLSEASAAETVTGWDAYDVWRRFIKEARERRKSVPESP